MSGKREKSDGAKTRPGSRMLRKARSFKDDIKAKVIRRTPSLGRSPSIGRSTSPHKSPKHKRHGLNRGSSFNEPGHTENMLQEEEDVDRLEHESRKVFQALRYMEDAVNKRILQLLPGAATIVLETIMEVNQLLSNYFTNQDSSALVSTTNQVYQSLAQLIRWSDQVLLRGTEEVNKENAHEVIKCVHDGVEELLQLSKEKIKIQGSSAASGVKPSTSQTLSNTDSSLRSSLPDIPLTPRERKILEETSVLSGYNSNHSDPSGYNNGLSRSSDCILDPSGGHYPTGLPPPKPPLPKNFQSLLNKKSSAVRAIRGGSPVMADSPPPPLPTARRSLSSSYDPSSPGSPSRGTLSAQSSLTAPDTSPHSTSPCLTATPLSQSPTSSLGSAFSASSEDLLGGAGNTDKPNSSRTSSLGSPTHVSGSSSVVGEVVRLSHYDNFTLQHSESQDSEQGTKELQDITTRIKSLTSSIDTPDDVFGSDLPSVSGTDEMDGAAQPPPLPKKKKVPTATLR